MVSGFGCGQKHRVVAAQSVWGPNVADAGFDQSSENLHPVQETIAARD